jgi:uncharacterized protein (TIGR03437 family)
LVLAAVIWRPGLPAQINRESVITTLAGATWTFPADGARATDAPISQVISLNTDLKGNIIFADPGNHVVSRLNSDGTITLIAGNGIRGFSGDGGPARSASLNRPLDAAVDSKGNLYISDTFNGRIRRVSADGTIDTWIRNVPSNSRIAIDRNDNLYFTDPRNCQIYRSTPDVAINTYAGTGVCGLSGDGGPATEARISPRAGISTDAAGNLYIAETGAFYIRKISPDGVITKVAGLAGDDTPEITSFLYPDSIVVDAGGNIIFSVPSSEIVIKLTPAGSVSTIAGTALSDGFAGDGGPADKALLTFPDGLAFDGSGRLYISDSGNYRIRRIEGDVINTVAGNNQFRSVPEGTPASQAFLFGPDGVAFDNAGNLLVAEVAASKVAKISPDGKFSVIAGTGTTGKGGVGGPARNALLSAPRSLAADRQGIVYFSDSQANVVYRITADGRLETAAGQIFSPGNIGDGGPATQAKLRAPFGIAFDTAGNLLIVDRDSNVIRRVATDGTISTFAGTGEAGFLGDGGPSTSAKLSSPQNIAIDASGNVLICDRNNNRIRKVTPDGVITTIAGDGKAATAGDDGPALEASLNQPFNLALDRFGNLFILEASGAVLRRIDTTGVISTIAGQSLLLFNLFDGVPARVALLDVDGLAFDSAGNLYLPSFNSDKIRVILADEPAYTTSTTTLAFSAVSGGAPADAQTLAVDASLPGIFVSTTSDSPWLKVNNQGFEFSPFNLKVQADPGGLAAGTYQGKIALLRFGAAAPFATIAVTFTVGPAVPPKLAVEPGSLAVSITAGGSAQTRSFRVLNSGGGALDFRIASSGAAAAAISLSSQSGTAAPGAPVTVTATFDPRSLQAGTVTASLTVSSATGGTATIPVTLSVAPRPQQLALSQRGLLFTAVQGGGVTPPQTLTVLNAGGGSFNWSATPISLQPGANWLSVTPGSGSSSAGSSTGVVTVSADPGRLSSPGVYYGLVRIASPGTTNAPQDVIVVFNLLSSDNSPGALLAPSGLIFVGASPSSQTFTITNLNAAPAQFRVTPATLDGGSWLQAVPNTTPNPIPSGGSQAITVQPAAALPGVYFGTLVVQFAGYHRDVDVLLVVPPAGSASPRGFRSADGCTATTLLPTFTSFRQDFTVPAAWPTPLEVKVVDDCGSPQTSGRVAVSFSNGDPLLPLVSLNDGRWQGTWFGRNPRSTQFTVTINADTDSPKLHGSKPYTGTMLANDDMPLVTPGGIASAAAAPPQAPIAPGGLISITGKSFASGAASASRLPLGTELGGTQVLLAGRSLPLIYSSGGRISAVVPYDIDVDTQFSVLVSRAGAVSGPETVAVAAAQPAVFLVDASGDANAASKLWAQLTAGTPSDSPAGPSNPVRAGDTLVVYCTGLGAVDTALDVSAPAPATAPKVKTAVSATIGGVTAQVSAAELVPGLTGVYRVRLTVPAGVPPGDATPLVVSAQGQRSLPVNLQVR